jgi:TolB-like protein/cytochrome c-type biogenesis protein CcmH/NrfG
MASLIEGYNYDIFISYRQKDNKYDGWVTEFVDNLKKELEATFKEEISVYFDINPHDGLLETHDVDASLIDKLKCLIFIPIISRTYCDPKSFAWGNEFKAFVEQASKDQFGLKIRLPNGNVANRVLPIKINDLDNTDIRLFESVLGGVVRGIEFIYKSAGVNRPLTPSDYPEKNQYKTFYRDQINKVANAIKENISGLKGEPLELESKPKEVNSTIKKPIIKEKSFKVSTGSKKRLLMVSAVLLAAAVIVVALILTDVIKGEKVARAEGIKSLVILPFNNYTGADSLEYVADALHSSLITDIQRISALYVPCKTTSSTFKNSNKTLKQITSELNVDAALETNVLSFRDSICLELRLIQSGKAEKQIWRSDYCEDKSQILNLYNRITRKIADELKVGLTQNEERLLDRSRIVDREAFDAYLRSQKYWGNLSSESLIKTREYLKSAIEKDPDRAPLYLGLANVWMMFAQMGFEEPSTAFSIAYENLNKALELDPDLTDAHHLMGWIAFVSEWDWAKAEREFLKVLAINPSNATSRIWYAHLLCVLQRHKEALEQSKLAIDLDPLNSVVQILYSTAQIIINGREADLTQIEKLLAEDPNNLMANYILNLVAFRRGDYDQVIKTEPQYLQLVGGQFDKESYREIERIYKEEGFSAAYIKIVPLYEDLANDKIIGPMELALVYTKGKQMDKTMDLIEKGYEIHDPTMPYIATRAYNFESLYNSPRFIAIMEKMNLPLPKN